MLQKFKNFLIILTIVFSGQNFYGQILKNQDNDKQIKQLTESSDLIIVGKVVSKKSFWNNNKSRIFTDVSIEAEEYLKGESTQNITIKVPGGEIGEIGELYTHVPKFENDEEIILFAQRDKQNKLRVTKGELGKISVITDKKTGQKFTQSNKRVDVFKNEIRLHSKK